MLLLLLLFLNAAVIIVCSPQGNVTSQPPVHRRVVAEYRRVESDQFQHAIRAEGADDDMSRYGAIGRHADSLGDRQLGAASLREVRAPRCSVHSDYDKE